MRSDRKPINFIVSFYIECTPEELSGLKKHLYDLAAFHYLEMQCSVRSPTLSSPGVYIYSVVFSLHKTKFSRELSVAQIRKLFEVDLKLKQRISTLYDLEFLQDNPL